MHNADFKSNLKPYSIREIYLVQIHKFCSILYSATFAVHCAVKSHVTMLSTQISYKYHIYAQCTL